MAQERLKWIVRTFLVAMVLIFNVKMTLANTSDEVPRFGVEIGIGTDIPLYGFLQSKVLYSPPIWDDRLACFLLYAKAEAFLGSDFPKNIHDLEIGTKIYVLHEGVFRPYTAIQGGVHFINAPSSLLRDTSDFFIYPLFSIGVGSDFMFTKHFGLTVGLLFSLYYPRVLLRPELNLKLQF